MENRLLDEDLKNKEFHFIPILPNRPEKQTPDERLHQRRDQSVNASGFLSEVLESGEGCQVLNVLSPPP